MMGKYEKQKTGAKSRKTPLIAVVVILVLACVIGVAAGLTGGGKPQEQPQAVQTEPSAAATQQEETKAPTLKLLTVDAEEQQGENMIVRTSYGTVRYPFAFSDLIGISAENQEDRSAILVCARLQSGEYPVFRILFNSPEGIPVGTLRLDGAVPEVSVTAELYEPEAITDQDELRSFYAAQEVFNDLAVSLAENEAFTGAQ